MEMWFVDSHVYITITWQGKKEGIEIGRRLVLIKNSYGNIRAILPPDSLWNIWYNFTLFNMEWFIPWNDIIESSLAKITETFSKF